MNAPFDKRLTTNMTTKGQVLIPKDVREAIGLVPGRPVDVGMNERGEAVVVPSTQRRNESPADRSERIMAAFKLASTRHRTGRDVDATMAELRGEEPLP